MRWQTIWTSVIVYMLRKLTGACEQTYRKFQWFPKRIQFLDYIRSFVNKEGSINSEDFWMEFGGQSSSTYRGRASYSVGKDKEARSANGDALLLGTKRARPIAISSGGLFFGAHL